MTKINKINNRSIILIAVAVLLAISQILIIQRYDTKVAHLESELTKRDMRTDLKSVEDLRKDYYFSETATLVSPHTMRLNMDKGQVDFVLVDVRAPEDYQRAHIKGAINIPFDGSKEAVDKFRMALEDGKKDRRSYAIVYCYSSACMLGRKTGQELAKQGISVKELSIGYNDWEQEHTVWNNPGEIYDINNYITSGSEPGELTPSKEFLNRPCSVDDKFSC